MTKLQKIALFSLLGLMALLVYVESTKPQPISWYQSYSRVDKIPFGTYVLHDLLKEKLEDRFIEKNRPPFEVLEDTTLNGTYFFTNNYVGFDKIELDRLLSWTEKGNTLFVGSQSFSSRMLDTLSLKLGTTYLLNTIRSQPLLELTNNNLKRDSVYHIERELTIRHFIELDTLSHTVLGVTQAYDKGKNITDPKFNFIQIPFGAGTILLHLQPEVFTNYFLLENNNVTYTEGVLSYIDTSKNLYWDNHYKSGKPIQTSPLYILLNNKYLKWAYYFMLIGAVLFVIFEGKRKQRKIPVVNPPANKTFEYTRTIAGMYLEQKDHKAIAEKQILLFKEYIRTQLRVPTEYINSRFLKSVASRSANSLEDTEALFTFIENVQKQPSISPELLLKLNKKINTFKHKADGKS